MATTSRQSSTCFAEVLTIRKAATEPSFLQKIPNELILDILEQCTTKDMSVLSQTSKHFYTIVTPIIFRSVDLSIHNRGEVLCEFPTPLWWLTTKRMEPSDSLICSHTPPHIQNRQEAFLRALITNPSLAEHIETFSWTLLLLEREPGPKATSQLFHIHQDEDYNNKLNADSAFNHIWSVFNTLTSVRRLDLGWFSRDLSTPLAHAFPSQLFPSATSIQLSGVMPYALAASIMFTNPDKITHLTLNNFQQSGLNPSIPTHQHVQKPAAWNNVAPFKATKTSYINNQGPMHNLLGALIDKCTSLRHLSLRKAGQRDMFDREYTTHWMTRDEDIYKEWSLFLTSVAPTLLTFTFEQGERFTPRADYAQPDIRPMDELFGEYMFPVLMERKGGWPVLKKVEVKGVQTFDANAWLSDSETLSWNAGNVGVEKELKEKLGGRVDVGVERKARTADHVGMTPYGYVAVMYPNPVDFRWNPPEDDNIISLS